MFIILSKPDNIKVSVSDSVVKRSTLLTNALEHKELNNVSDNESDTEEK